MALKQLTVKTDEDAHALFNQLYTIEKESRAALTVGAFFEEMVNGYANPKTKTVEVASQEQSTRVLELEAENEKLTSEIKELNQEIVNYLERSTIELIFITSVRQLLNLPGDAPGDDILTEIRATQQRAMNALTEQCPLAENEIMFTIPEPHLSLLRATAERLSGDHGQVTIKDILLDMFARYTIDQYSEWFYPFVIKESDFLKITGYTQKQLQAWLKKK